jgi:predicted SAM-dependent methyltransferase
MTVLENPTNLLDLRKQIIDSMTSPVLYELGCGENPEPGFTGLDVFSPREDVLKVDLYKYPWPIDSESVDYFRASHFLEHIPDWDAHFNEIYRCLKPGGCYEIIVPYYWNSRWAQDPDHKQTIVGERFKYLMQPWRKMNKISHYGATVNFEMIGWFELLNEDFLNQGYDDDYMRWARAHLINVIDDIACVIRKLPLED